ncbi:MAG: hypothetical protein H7235_11540, partial [Bdellovibrionaceae bacterium]|nr:hypothetical protein [Pseudobdellovibrionaceae bacterium]
MKMKSLLVMLCLQSALSSVAYAGIATKNLPEATTFISEYKTAKNEALPMKQRWA